jgi:Rps23 Pro-64 3,4-dihydroxylase Tpa1-like proline 4-hydroxylase
MNKDDLFKNGFCVVDVDELIPKEMQLIIREQVEHLSDPIMRGKHFHYRIDAGGKDSKVPLNEVQHRLKLIKKQGQKVSQQWYQSFDFGNFHSLEMYMKDVIENYAKTIYQVAENNVIHAHVQLTIYENGDFIVPHQDGQNAGRLAIFLVYMSDPEEYHDGGGKLLIKDNGINESIIPTFGKFVILDFTKNNVNHAVEEVKNGFRRTCFLAIVTERNEGQQ